MENPHTSKSHLLAYKVNVQLDVFSPAMMNGVGGEVDRRDIVTVDNGGLRDIKKQLPEKLAKPRALGDGIGHGPVLGLGARS